MKNPDDKAAAEIQRLLRRAAEVATSHSMGSQPFVLAAWEAFLSCNPAIRAKLEAQTMEKEFAHARRHGKLALA